MTDRKDCSGPFDPGVGPEDLAREALVPLVPEFALIVHLFDRLMGAGPRGHGTLPIAEPGVAA